MRRDPLEFLWEVHPAGYEWTPPASGTGSPTEEASLLLSPRRRTGTNLQVRLYVPLREAPAIYRTFASVKPNPHEVLKCANKYGCLTRRPTSVSGSPTSGSGPTAKATGETYSFWRDALLALQRAVALWDMVQAGDTEALSRHVVWRPDAPGSHAILFDLDPSLASPAGPEGPPDRSFSMEFPASPGGPTYDPSEPQDVVLPAQDYILRAIQQQLAAHVTPTVAWTDDRATMLLELMPKNLLGALWLQFAQVAAREKSRRICKECGKPFAVSEDERVVRLFCSDACRGKAYRNRQNEARKRHAAGESFAAIAEALESDERTVKGWITGRKE